MGLTISSLFSRLFGKRQMRILMGNFIFIFINYVGVCWWRHESKWRHINLFLTSKFLFWKSLLRPEVPKFSLLMHSPTAALFMLTLWTLRLFKVPVTREYTECFLTLLFMYSVGLRWSSGLERQFSRSWRRSRVRLPVSPFLRECPEEKSREKSSRIVNERERDDVDIRSTGGKVAREAGVSGNGYENWFGSFRRRLNG